MAKCYLFSSRLVSYYAASSAPLCILPTVNFCKLYVYDYVHSLHFDIYSVQSLYIFSTCCNLYFRKTALLASTHGKWVLLLNQMCWILKLIAQVHPCLEETMATKTHTVGNDTGSAPMPGGTTIPLSHRGFIHSRQASGPKVWKPYKDAKNFQQWLLKPPQQLKV